MLEKETAFYAAHKNEFYEKYYDKWLIITGESLWGVYDTIKEAVENTLEHFKPGEFMLHKPARDGMAVEIGPYFNVPSEASLEPGYIVTELKKEPVEFFYAD